VLFVRNQKKKKTHFLKRIEIIFLFFLKGERKLRYLFLKEIHEDSKQKMLNIATKSLQRVMKNHENNMPLLDKKSNT
jgi:hypothetical protein